MSDGSNAWGKIRHMLFPASKELDKRVAQLEKQVQDRKRLITIAKQIAPNAHKPEVLRRLVHALHSVQHHNHLR